MRVLGGTQQAVLKALDMHGSWTTGGCGWVWETRRGTEKILRTLVSRGAVETTPALQLGHEVFVVSDVGRAYLSNLGGK